ncbi:MAG: hypothetical protein R3C99_01345 [Pirellulaceae bacterium]|nr:hypothetical protein [Planctomycetales bacterium]MCA9204842.1 hypothetical protein [Planctomycetales bacterium]MCA9221209.1 hypothetical protein [Planctomycetales bacterium]MCA9225722.1 hypothetical protein [Planctomycetales bacterium]
MYYKISSLFNSTIRMVDGFDRETWLYIFSGLVVVGYFCLRGYTQRM